MIKVGIIGYGSLGKQIVNFLLEAGIAPNEIVVFDDNTELGEPFNAYSLEQYHHIDFYIGLGYNHLKLKDQIISALLHDKRKVPFFIHRTAYVHPTATIDAGVIIYPMACIDQEVIIKQGSLINNSVTISHNSQIGNVCFIAPSATLCGHVNIGNYSFIGASSVISNHITIGDNCVLGIGTTITSDIKSNHSVIANKGTIINKQLRIK